MTREERPMASERLTAEELAREIDRCEWVCSVLKDSPDRRAMIQILAAARRCAKLEAAMQTIVQVDKTRYEHHEPRPDGTLPRADGGTCWLTPKAIARAALEES